MKCPYCGSLESKVVDKRETENGQATRRRRECLSCKKRYTTYERVEMLDLMVVKKDERREPYSRQKLKIGIQKACEKRPISHEQIEKVVEWVEAKIRNLEKKEVSSKKIGELVMKKLRSLDKVAYIRFASVYREFGDLESFHQELKKLQHSLKRKKRG